MKREKKTLMKFFEMHFNAISEWQYNELCFGMLSICSLKSSSIQLHCVRRLHGQMNAIAPNNKALVTKTKTSTWPRTFTQKLVTNLWMACVVIRFTCQCPWRIRRHHSSSLSRNNRIDWTQTNALAFSFSIFLGIALSIDSIGNSWISFIGYTFLVWGDKPEIVLRLFFCRVHLPPQTLLLFRHSKNANANAKRWKPVKTAL